ncbi:MAG: AbrB/MazE/SpoVT family DNA-binding domain-containing protein [Planctomycetota bacterium]|nr:AbrB/MazE/SpoVT family DNA-binding domain-containing protein [Planctomycetota bacterium]
MKIGPKGQVTIPAKIRAAAGLLPHTEVEFRVTGGKVFLEKISGQPRGRKVIAAMRGRATRRMTTDQIMALTRGE